jgi:phosphoribosylanthranilate isomerase
MIVKICGITTLEAAQSAQCHGADLIGFVFTNSKRQIAVAQAVNITRQLRGIGTVGVFVDQPLTEVREIAERCQLDYIQLHGNESSAYCAALQRPVIKAFHITPRFVPEACNLYKAAWALLDSYRMGQSGGTGIPFDWLRYRELITQIKQPFFVAGGLHAKNVTAAVNLLHPHGVDISGGVETEGVKDPEKIRQFITAVRKGS